jgi:glycosyltransferase involved in cell wall biosynthesis
MSRPSGFVIAGNGRLSHQKDPHFFAEAFTRVVDLLPGVGAVWIGGGDQHYVDELSECGVRVTGWLSRDAALQVLSTCSVYLHTALWEGFPISILEASAMGLPVIARNRPYLRGIEMPMVVESPRDVVDLVAGLLDEEAQAAAAELTRRALSSNSDVRQHDALSDLYASSLMAASRGT